MNHIGIFCRDAEIPAWLATDPRWPDVQRIIDESRRYREAKQTAPPEPPRPPQPTEAELVERALKHLEREDRGYFAQDLGTARRVYHDYPEFVTAPEFPAEQLADYVEYNGEEPPESEGLTPLSPGYAEHLMERAREYAREHLARAAA